MPENIENEFVNRENELKDICRSVALKIVIEAPAGFGKTHLLKAVKRKFLEVDVNDAAPNIRKGCALIDLQKYAGKDGITKIINEIAQQLGNKRVKASDYEGACDELRSHCGNYGSLLFLFDSVDRSDDETLRILYNDLLEEDLYEVLHPKLKVVFAGRYLKYIKSNTDRWAKRYLPSWDGYNFMELQPFTARVIEELLRKHYENTKGHPDQEPKGKYEKWSRGIMELSGGHPRTIKKLADYLSDRCNWVADFTNNNKKASRYKDYVKGEIDDVLEGIVDKKRREDLIKLSVFRIFNLDTIEYLKSIGEFDKTRGAYEIFAPLAKTGLVRKYPKSIFYSDSIVRNLILSQLKNESWKDFDRLNKSALLFYNKLIDEAVADYQKNKEANKNKIANPPLYIEEYIKEAIYHLTQTPMVSHEILVGGIIDGIKRYAGNLEQVGLVINDQDCRDRIEGIIFDDNEIVAAVGSRGEMEKLLNQLFNQSAVGTAHPRPSKYRSGSRKSQKVRILFFAANPNKTKRIQLDEEIRNIRNEIRLAQHVNRLEIISEEAVRSNEIIRLINEHTPDIVHFSGHGSPTDGVLVVDKSGAKPKAIGALAIKKIFEAAPGNIRLVVLNACYTHELAEALVEIVDCAVGTDKSIGDNAAIAFAAAFYGALGFGYSVERAFKQGEAALSIEVPDHEDVLVLRSRTGVKPSEVFLVNRK